MLIAAGDKSLAPARWSGPSPRRRTWASSTRSCARPTTSSARPTSSAREATAPCTRACWRTGGRWRWSGSSSAAGGSGRSSCSTRWSWWARWSTRTWSSCWAAAWTYGPESLLVLVYEYLCNTSLDHYLFGTVYTTCNTQLVIMQFGWRILFLTGISMHETQCRRVQEDHAGLLGAEVRDRAGHGGGPLHTCTALRRSGSYTGTSRPATSCWTRGSGQRSPTSASPGTSWTTRAISAPASPELCECNQKMFLTSECNQFHDWIIIKVLPNPCLSIFSFFLSWFLDEWRN